MALSFGMLAQMHLLLLISVVISSEWFCFLQETEKVALAEATGLDQKQINNWFINQRKRHWKPSEDMQFMVMDGLHPQNAAALYMEGHYMGEGPYRLGPWGHGDVKQCNVSDCKLYIYIYILHKLVILLLFMLLSKKWSCIDLVFLHPCITFSYF